MGTPRTPGDGAERFAPHAWPVVVSMMVTKLALLATWDLPTALGEPEAPIASIAKMPRASPHSALFKSILVVIIL
jgi:hypothetical protein